MNSLQYARADEIRATFDLGDGAYYRAWIDAVLPVLEAFVQANIDSKKAVIVYDQQGKRIACSATTDYSNALVLRCDEHRHFDILKPPSKFDASEQIILPSDRKSISVDGFQYETKTYIKQDRRSLFNCMGYCIECMASRPFGLGLHAERVGPSEVLYRFDCWITEDHPDLRSQLDKLLKDHEGN
jgi:hypothetical protein